MKDRTFLTNLEYYKVFYYTALYGSMTAAAEHLCLTQPTVTSTLQRLEEQLGATLFLRSRRGVRLTEEGTVLWNRVEPACNLLLIGEQELEDLRSLNGGTLSIASTEMSFRTYVLPVLSRFSADYPNVKVRFRNALTEAILDMVQSGEADMAILHAPFSADPRLELQKIGENEECFAVGPKYRALAEQPRTLQELQQLPFITVPEGSGTKRFAEELFHRQGLACRTDIEVTTIELVIQAVIHNLGFAMLPWDQIRHLAEQGQIFRVPIVGGEPLHRDAFAIRCSRFAFSSAARVFWEDYLLPQLRDADRPDIRAGAS